MKSLNKKDVEKISEKTRKDLKKRDDFESNIEIYRSLNENAIVLIKPEWNKFSSKKWHIVYYYENSNSENKATFEKYRNVKKFVKENLRKLNDNEKAKLMLTGDYKNKINNEGNLEELEVDKDYIVYEAIRNFFKSD